MAISVAIIGSGPAGFYTAEALSKTGCSIDIDIIERLPTPYGLIRGGVAPDHQMTKKVAKRYEKTALFGAVNYFGNVEVGRDVGLDELREMYDAVVLAVGAPGDRKLGVPGADMKGVHGSAAFVGWYNGHPDFRSLEPDLNVETAVVIGAGNVALDCARILARTKRGLSTSDIAAHAAEALENRTLKESYLCARRGPLEARFTSAELRELGTLPETVPLAKPSQIPETVPDDMEPRAARLAKRNLDTLRGYTENDPASKPKRLNFEFFASPVEILGGGRVEAVRFERTERVDGRVKGTGETFDIPCGLVVAAIGYRVEPVPGLPYDEAAGAIPNDDGKVMDGVYAVGWIKRGPTGVISSNRPDGVAAAEHICRDFAGGSDKPGREALKAHLAATGARVVDFDGWRKIETAEEAAADGAGAPRRKFTAVADMLKVLDE